MPDPNRRSELVLIVCFLAIIFAVPAFQTALEISQGERVQATDLFRYRPTAANLRKFERALEEKSWFQQNLRPAMQELSFNVLGDTGAKGLRGSDPWVFFRPDVRYLLDQNRLESPAKKADSHGFTWVEPVPSQTTRRESVVQAIAKFRDQLKERDIDLILMPVPGKPSVYPDKLSARSVAGPQDFRSPTAELIAELEKQGIATIDLFRVFGRARVETPMVPLYLAQDTHWTPRGAGLAAGSAAQKIRDLGLAPPGSRKYESSAVRVKRWGDILEMSQVAGLKQFFALEEVECEQIRSSTGKLLVPSASEQSGVFKTPGGAPLLVIGDSFCRIYQLAEPQSLGEVVNNEDGSPSPTASLESETAGSKRYLPGSAGFLSLLMRELKSPIDYIVSDGGAATDVRRKLSINAEILEDKKVVLWEFVERDISLGRDGWEDVPLPTLLGP